MPLKPYLVCFTLTLAVFVATGAETLPDPGKKPVPPLAEPVLNEEIIRQRFLVAHQTAQTPEARADVIKMLRGMKERESQRLLAGMLGDRSEVVRLAACVTIAATPEPDGYFVKPLMGLLTDPHPPVRIAAAEALANASVKADAVKALSFALIAGVGANPKDPKNKNSAAVLAAYNSALEKLSGQSSPKSDAREQSSYWMDYWKLNEEPLRAADAKALQVTEPVRPAGLPKDSFDKPQNARSNDDVKAAP